MQPATVSITGHNGVELAGDAHGDPAHPPVLLLHGGGQTRHSWGGTAKRLASQGMYAVNMDLRGHGDSAWCPEGDYTHEAFRLDVTAICAALGRPAVVGASMGGIAALVAEGQPGVSVMRALVLVDVGPVLEPVGVQRIVDFMTNKPDGFATLEEAADAIAAYQPHRPRPKDLTGLAKNLRLGEDGRWRWHWDPRFMDGDRRPRAATQPNLLMEYARNVEVPSLLVRGRMSDVISEAGVQAYQEAIPHGEFVDVGGAGHMVAGDRNDAFTEAVAEFLLRVTR
jgi:pimeloyl-ACP methyl ester carboxylesterase